MRRYWLIFAQAVTVCLGILFVVTTLRPDLLRPVGTPTSTPPATSRVTAATSYADAVMRAAPAVVNVYTAKHVNVPLIPLLDDPVLRQWFGNMPGLNRRQATTSLGSGVVVNEDGIVLTNYHVVQAADAIEIALADGRKDSAQLIGADPDTDLAVLKLAKLRNLPTAHIGNDHLRVGDVVLAIGNPFGVGQTTTQGIISALGRTGLGLNAYESFIQTDAAINPGNSGGALIDTQGNLVGINTAIYSQSGGSLGIGFATPMEIASKVMAEIIKTGKVDRGWLGIDPQDVTPELARVFQLDPKSGGAIIAGMVRGGPADRAGLRVGDVVKMVGGKSMRDAQSLLIAIAQLPSGKPVTVGVIREGQPLDIEVLVGARPGKAR